MNTKKIKLTCEKCGHEKFLSNESTVKIAEKTNKTISELEDSDIYDYKGDIYCNNCKSVKISVLIVLGSEHTHNGTRCKVCDVYIPLDRMIAVSRTQRCVKHQESYEKGEERHASV